MGSRVYKNLFFEFYGTVQLWNHRRMGLGGRESAPNAAQVVVSIHASEKLLPIETIPAWNLVKSTSGMFVVKVM